MKILVATWVRPALSIDSTICPTSVNWRAAVIERIVLRKVAASSKVLGGDRILRPTCPTMPRPCGKRSIS